MFTMTLLLLSPSHALHMEFEKQELNHLCFHITRNEKYQICFLIIIRIMMDAQFILHVSKLIIIEFSFWKGQKKSLSYHWNNNKKEIVGASLQSIYFYNYLYKKSFNSLIQHKLLLINAQPYHLYELMINNITTILTQN